jgi:very-short-patch-repair endonuclease
MMVTKDNFIQQMVDTWGFNPYDFMTEYKGSNQPLTFKCKKCGTEKTLKRARNIIFKRGDTKFETYPCPVCNPNDNSEKLNENYKKFEKRIEELSGIKNLYTLLEKYEGNKKPIKLKCNICGYDEICTNTSNIISTLTRSNGKKYYCPQCNNLVRSKKTYEERLKEANPNIINLEPFVNRRTSILHKCLVCDYEWKCVPDSRLRGNGCPQCSQQKLVSSYENDLFNYIQTFYKNEIIRNSRKILENKQELDFYFPDLKIAIEIDGNYWHNYEKKGIQYHLNKTKECEKLDIQLIHIFSDELVNKKDLIYNKIKYENHIQGEDRANISLGLYYENKLVSVMTFCKPRKCLGQSTSNSTYDYELSRFASNNNYLIVGGFSKLFKYFERNYEWKSIITYADRRWSNGNLYLKNGFTFDHFSKPNYWYFNRNDDTIRLHRFSFRKDRLETLFPDVYEKELSEYEIMKKANYLKIYDCGSYIFRYDK